MPTEPAFDASHAAVLAMDCQASIVSIYAKPVEEFVERAAAVLRAARKANLPVIHIRLGFRPGLPEVSSRNKLFASIKSSTQRQQLFEGAAGEIHAALGPEPDDIVITKRRINAFTGTELDMILRASGVETLVLFGISTSGVVLSTVLHAFDADYKPIVITDCCADLDAELHNSLVKSLFPHRGEVLTAAEFLGALAAR